MQAAEQVYLVNSQPRLLHLPDEVKRNEQTGEVIVGLGNGLPIPPSAPREKDGKPVITSVPGKYWDKIKGNEQVRVWMRKGWLSLVESSDHVIPAKDKITLSDYNVQTATVLVEGEGDIKLLNGWKRSETRDEIKASIDARINAIKAEASQAQQARK